MPTTRRDFLAASAAAIVATPHILRRPAAAPDPVILFQGDSITDAGRNRAIAAANDPAALGRGYPLNVFQSLAALKPYAKLSVLNRGVSGNIVPDLRTRWQADTLDLKPTILSILIGVNDVWHTLGKTPADEVVATYEAGYAALLEQTRAALPDVRLVVLEPFVLRTGAVNDSWFPEFDQLRAACRRVADHARADFVPLHDMFQARAAKSKPDEWLADGVHPTAAGHSAIAKEWLDKVKL